MSNSSTTARKPGLDSRGKFAKGNSLASNRKPKQSGSIDKLRQDVLDHWANSDAGKVLTEIKKTKPVEYAKLITALAPKQADATITRNVVFQLFSKEPPADWQPLTDEDNVVDSNDDGSGVDQEQGRLPKDPGHAKADTPEELTTTAESGIGVDATEPVLSVHDSVGSC